MTETNNHRVRARAAEKRYRDKNREKLRACWRKRRRTKRVEWNAYQRIYIARRYRPLLAADNLKKGSKVPQH